MALAKCQRTGDRPHIVEDADVSYEKVSIFPQADEALKYGLKRWEITVKAGGSQKIKMDYTLKYRTNINVIGREDQSYEK